MELLTVFEASPAGDGGHSADEVRVVIGHANWHDVRVELYRRLEFQQGYVVFEGRRIVAAVWYDPVDVSRHAAFLLQLALYVKLTEHGDQRRQESANSNAPLS